MTRRTVSAAVLATVASLATLAQEPAPPPDATIKGGDVALVKSVRVVAERIAGILKLPPRPEFVAVRADDAARASEARTRAERLLPPQVAAARGRAWEDLGLGAPGDPAALAMALELDLAGMTLDASRARLLVDPTRLLPDSGHGDPSEDPDASLLLATGVAPDEPVAGHYVAHVLTDDPAPAAPTTDALLARSALSEGTANVAALVLLFGGVGLETEVVSGKLHPDDVLGGRLIGPGTHATSPAVAAFLQFAYLDGFVQAASLAKEGNIQRLLAARKARKSTHDVMHLDRPPVAPVDIPAPVLPAAAKLTLADRDTLGEQGIVVLISQLTGKDNLGLIAGDGWMGDSVWRFEPAGVGGEGVTYWIGRFASPEAARDFSYGLERSLQARFPNDALTGDPASERVMTRSDRVFRLTAQGSEVCFRVAPPRIDTLLAVSPKKKPAERPSTPKKN